MTMAKKQESLRKQEKRDKSNERLNRYWRSGFWGPIPDRARYMPPEWLATDEDRAFMKRWRQSMQRRRSAAYAALKWIWSLRKGGPSIYVARRLQALDLAVFAYLSAVQHDGDLDEVGELELAAGNLSCLCAHLEGWCRPIGQSIVLDSPDGGPYRRAAVEPPPAAEKPARPSGIGHHPDDEEEDEGDGQAQLKLKPKSIGGGIQP